MAQKSINRQTIQGVETGYSNNVVVHDEGYYILQSTYSYPNPGKDELLISCFDNCHELLWTKKYRSSSDVDIDDVVIHNGRLVILAGSGNKYPLIITLSLTGEKIWCYRYINSSFDNHFNLKAYNNTYHFYGPSDGQSHFAIDDNGEVLFANVLKNSGVTSGIPFGCTILSNGQSIRRHGNVLVATNYEQDILWAHQFMQSGGSTFSERKPIEVDNGFVVIMEVDDSLSTLVKFDYQGNIVWNTPDLNIKTSSTPLDYSNGQINIVSVIDENPIRLSLTEVDENTGIIITNQYFEFSELNGIIFPAHKKTALGDHILSGSVQISFSNGEWEDMLLINPQLSTCHDVINITIGDRPLIEFIDITDQYELEITFPTKEEHPLFVSEESEVYFEKCQYRDTMYIDTSLNCNNTYVFNNPYPSSNYLWSDGGTDSIRTFDQPSKLEVLVDNCRINNLLSLNISNKDCVCDVFVPNIICTNANNLVNSLFTVSSNCTLDDYTISIYDRWGNHVYSSEDQSKKWDGKYQGQTLSSGVYTYKLMWVYQEEKELNMKYGTVTLVH